MNKKVQASVMNETEEEDTDSEDGINIPKLTRDNYRLWSKIMELYLKSRRLWKVVSGDVPKPPASQPKHQEGWKVDNASAMAYILSNIETRQVDFVINCDTAKEQWDVLKTIHKPVGRSRLIPLSKRLYSYQVRLGSTIGQAAAEIRKLAWTIGEIESSMKPSDFTLALVLMSAVKGGRYEFAKSQLGEIEDLTFIDVLVKFKGVEESLRYEKESRDHARNTSRRVNS